MIDGKERSYHDHKEMNSLFVPSQHHRVSMSRSISPHSMSHFMMRLDTTEKEVGGHVRSAVDRLLESALDGRRHTLRPVNVRARSLSPQVNLLALEWSSECVDEIVPDPVWVECVAEGDLRIARWDAIVLLCDLEGDAAANIVAPVLLLPLLAGLDLDGAFLLRTDDPEVDGGVAVVGHLGFTDGLGEAGKGGCESEKVELDHIAGGWVVFVGVFMFVLEVL
jgi:hypothetical protein